MSTSNQKRAPWLGTHFILSHPQRVGDRRAASNCHGGTCTLHGRRPSTVPLEATSRHAPPTHGDHWEMPTRRRCTGPTTTLRPRSALRPRGAPRAPPTAPSYAPHPQRSTPPGRSRPATPRRQATGPTTASRRGAHGAAGPLAIGGRPRATHGAGDERNCARPRVGNVPRKKRQLSEHQEKKHVQRKKKRNATKTKKTRTDDRRHQSPADPAGGGPTAALARRPCPTAPSPSPRHAARPLPAVTLPHPARRTSTRAPRAGAARHAARAPPS